MRIINISKKRFNEVEPLKLDREIVNTEAIIYDFTYRGEHKIIKKLYHQDGEVFASKLYTIEMLDTYKKFLPSNFIIPDALISVNGETVGFTVPFVKGENLFSLLYKYNTELSNKEKIYYLKKVGYLVEQLNNIRTYTDCKKLYLNDLHEANFIINKDNNELFAIDLDSIKIGENMHFPSKFLTSENFIPELSNKYVIGDNGCIKPDCNTELYCYSVMILNYLYGANIFYMNLEEFYDYLAYLIKIGVNKELIDCFGKLTNVCDNVNPVDLLDSLTDENIARSSKIVFEQTKNRL